jgi:hypothetical protein
MAKCKNCISENVCKYKDETVSLGITVKETIHDCKDFKNKADFVEVVRCKDCKHRYSYEVFDRDRQENYECRGCHILHEDFGENGFCSYGERRDI